MKVNAEPATEAALLKDRLQQVERHCRLLQAIVFAMFLGGVWVASETFGKRTTLEAERFVLRDEFGTLRGEFSLNGVGDPELLLRDRQGREQIGLRSIGDDSAILNLSTEGDLQTALIAQRGGPARLKFFDSGRQIVSAFPDFEDGRNSAASEVSRQEAEPIDLTQETCGSDDEISTKVGQIRLRLFNTSDEKIYRFQIPS